MVESEVFWQDELRRFLPDPAAALEEALGYVACPVCQVLARLPFAYFSVVSGRWPEEPNLRAVVIAAGGFCNHHTWRLNSMQSHLAIARIFVDVLAALAERPLELQAECPVCHLERLASEVLLRSLVERLDQEAERERYGELLGLCYPHWRAMLRMNLSAPVRQFIIDAQAARTRLLRQEVQGFLDKAPIELKWTRTRDETHAPRRALLKTGGNEGI